jgi:hypothetical protein
VVGDLRGALPFRAVILRRDGDNAVIDKGAADGVVVPKKADNGAAGNAQNAPPAPNYVILRPNSMRITDAPLAAGPSPVEIAAVKPGKQPPAPPQFALAWNDGDVLGNWTPSSVNDEVSLGGLAVKGYFDYIAAGDEVFIASKAPEPVQTVAKKGKKAKAPPPPQAAPSDPELRALLRTLRD